MFAGAFAQKRSGEIKILAPEKQLFPALFPVLLSFFSGVRTFPFGADGGRGRIFAANSKERERPREGGETGKGKGKLQVGIQGTEYPPPPKKNKQSSAAASPIPEGKGGREKVAHQWSRRSGGEGDREGGQGPPEVYKYAGQVPRSHCRRWWRREKQIGRMLFWKEKEGKEKEGGLPILPLFCWPFFLSLLPTQLTREKREKSASAFGLSWEGKEASRIFAIPFFGLNSSLEGGIFSNGKTGPTMR